MLSPPSIRPSVRPLCFLLLNHWTKFNQIWCVSYPHEWCEQGKKIFLGRGQKVKYHLISITKSMSKIFIPNFVCVVTNERYISDGFFILSPGSCPRGGTWGYLGAKFKFCPAVCPLCYLLLNHYTKLNQIFVWVTHMYGARNVKFFFGPAPWGPGEGSKGQISFNFNYKVNFKDFYSKLCVCSHKWKIQNILDGIFILSPGSWPRVRTLGHWGCAQGVKKCFFKHGHVAYQIDVDDKQNRMQVTFSS